MDQQLEILINREWIAPWADRLLAFVSDFGAWAPWLLFLAFLGIVFGNFKFRTMMLSAALAVGICDGIGVNLLKHAVGRPRPSQEEPGVRMVTLGTAPKPLPRIFGVTESPIVTFPQGPEPPQTPGLLAADHPTEGRSFPSGHAANNMAVATVLMLFYPRRGWIYLPVALAIGYARIYTGSHWPLDVVAGWLLGLVGGWVAVRILQMSWNRWSAVIVPHLAREHPALTP